MSKIYARTLKTKNAAQPAPITLNFIFGNILMYDYVKKNPFYLDMIIIYIENDDFFIFTANLKQETMNI